MAIYSFEKCERETMIRIDDTTDRWEIYTTQPAMMAKLDRLCESNPDEWECTEAREFDSIDHQIISKEYRCPKNLISIRSGSVKYSDEQKAKMAERLRRAKFAE